MKLIISLDLEQRFMLKILLSKEIEGLFNITFEEISLF
jgi:hypothetical protein